MIADLRRLVKSKDLLYMLMWRDIRVRYKQSIMGFFWAILMPALIVGAGVLVRLITARYSGNSLSTDDLSSVMVRAVVWSFFIAGIRFATISLVGNPNLITKIAFPKEVFPISAVLANLLDFAVASALVLTVVSIIGGPPGIHAFWMFPLLIMLVMFTIGLSLVLAALNLFFRDVKYIVEVLLTYAIFFTPVLYDARDLGEWQSIIMLNPVAPILEGVSGAIVFDHSPDPLWTSYTLGISLLLLIGGYWLFKQLEGRFAESI